MPKMPDKTYNEFLDGALQAEVQPVGESCNDEYRRRMRLGAAPQGTALAPQHGLFLASNGHEWIKIGQFAHVLLGRCICNFDLAMTYPEWQAHVAEVKRKDA